VISAPGNIQARNVIRSGFKSFLDSYNYELIGNPVPNPKRNVVLFFVGFPGGSLAQVESYSFYIPILHIFGGVADFGVTLVNYRCSCSMKLKCMVI